jgi:hypothetical protein
VYIIAALMIASFLLNIALVTAYPSATFYLPVTRFWELLLGALIVSVYHRIQLSPIVRNLMSVCGLLMVLAASYFYRSDTPFPGWFALLPTVGTAAIIVGGQSAWLNRKVLSHSIPVYIGLISYPLYLWHWPLLSIAQVEVYGNPVSPAIRLALVVAAFVLAAATYELIEKPIRFHSNRRRAVIGLVSAMLIVAAAGAVSAPFREAIGRHTASIGSEKLQWDYWENRNCTSLHPWDKKHGWWFCIANSRRPTDVIVLGNSHANHLYPGLVKAFPESAITSIATCDPTIGIRRSWTNPGQTSARIRAPASGRRSRKSFCRA